MRESMSLVLFTLLSQEEARKNTWKLSGMGQADSTLNAAPLSPCDYSLQIYTDLTYKQTLVWTGELQPPCCVSAPKARL